MNCLYDIIVSTWNLTDKTLECFSRVNKYTKNFRIIWVDNASTLESYNKVKCFLITNKIPYTSYRCTTNLGFVKGTNIGLGISTAPWKVFLNNDVYVTANWLEQMTNCAHTNGYDMIGPVTSSNGGQYQSSSQLQKKIRENMPVYDNSNIDIFANRFHKVMRGDHVKIHGGMLAFFCTAIKAQVIKKVGYLSEDFGLGFGDDDYFCALARRYGFNLGVDLSTFVHHFHRTTFKDNFTPAQIAEMQTKALKRYKDKIKSS